MSTTVRTALLAACLMLLSPSGSLAQWPAVHNGPIISVGNAAQHKGFMTYDTDLNIAYDIRQAGGSLIFRRWDGNTQTNQFSGH